MRLLLTVATILMVAAPHSLAQQGSRSRKGVPSGNWTLGCAPSQTPGTIVDLYMVGSDSSNGVKVTDVWLANRSNQEVAAVKIGWKLYEISNPSKILLTGETPQYLGVGLAPGEKRVVTFPIVSFARIHSPLLRGGKLEGDFRMELWVTDVQFDNANDAKGSSYFSVRKAAWRIGPTVKSLKVSSKPAPSTDDDLGCPGQECRCLKTKSMKVFQQTRSPR